MKSEYKVISLASVGPGARACQILADLGFSLIQVSPTESKRALQIKPENYAYGARRFIREVRIDLKSESGIEAFKALIDSADVLIESFRPGVMTRLGLDYKTLHSWNSRLVYCSISGYGQAGEYSQWAGHDINYLAMGGFLDCSGRDENGVPALPGATVADSAGGGMHAVISIQAALLRRQAAVGTEAGASVEIEKKYGGSYLDVSVLDGVLSMMSLHVDRYLATGEKVTYGSDLLTGKYAWYACYKTLDGKFIALGAIEDKFYRNLCRELGLQEFVDRQYEISAQSELKRMIAERIGNRTRDYWVQALCSQDTCASPVLSIDELAESEHLSERETFNKVHIAGEGSFMQLGPLIAGARPLREVVVDRSVTHVGEVFTEAGVDLTQVSTWIEKGIVQ